MPRQRRDASAAVTIATRAANVVSATRIETSGSRGFTRKSKSITVPQLWQVITSQWCFDVSAAAIVGHAHMRPLADSLALKCWMTANASA